jgi:hypothetical protein
LGVRQDDAVRAYDKARSGAENGSVALRTARVHLRHGVRAGFGGAHDADVHHRLAVLLGDTGEVRQGDDGGGRLPPPRAREPEQAQGPLRQPAA